jgi:hypothetical protein
MIGFIGTSLQLQSIITAHNQWLPKTRSILYWTTSIFSSAVTDLVLIYESVTSSASGVRWLALHSWTLNFWILSRLNYDSLMNAEWVRVRVRVRVTLRLSWTELTFRRTEYRSPCLTVPLFFFRIRCHGNVLSKPLPSNGHIRHNMSHNCILEEKAHLRIKIHVASPHKNPHIHVYVYICVYGFKLNLSILFGGHAVA